MTRTCMQVTAAAVLFLLFPLWSCSRQPVYPSPPLSGRDAVIDIQSLKPDVPRFYTYRYRDTNISFFVVNRGGKVLSFFDACASCYSHRQGYRGGEDGVTCRQCGVKFPVSKLEGLGGCYPITLKGRTVDGKYVIPLENLEAEAGKF